MDCLYYVIRIMKCLRVDFSLKKLCTSRLTYKLVQKSKIIKICQREVLIRELIWRKNCWREEKRYFHRNNKSVCLLSNDVLEWSEFLTEYHQLNFFFKEKIVSGEVHMRKPEKEIFSYALDKLKCAPESCVFVDNSVKNLLVAEEIGIRTILFNRDGEEYNGNIVNGFVELGEMLESIK